MDSPTQNTSLQRLQNVEKRVVRVLELAGSVMDEFTNSTGSRKDYVNNHCAEFMKLIKDIQVTLREEIKSACEYRPFEKCDYSSRISNEVYGFGGVGIFALCMESLIFVCINIIAVLGSGALTLASVLLYPGTRGGGDVFSGWVPFN